jgi:hypothetical protein
MDEQLAREVEIETLLRNELKVIQAESSIIKQVNVCKYICTYVNIYIYEIFIGFCAYECGGSLSQLDFFYISTDTCTHTKKYM